MLLRLAWSVPAWWVLSRVIAHRTNLGHTAADWIAGVVVVVTWPVALGVLRMFGLARQTAPTVTPTADTADAAADAAAAPPPPAAEHRVALGPTAFSTGFWGWLIARQVGRR